MARVLDITDRLTFDGNPSLKIRDKELEVNADAPTMLKVMNLMQDGGVRLIIWCFRRSHRKRLRK